MTDWKIHVLNKTGDSGTPGRHVKVMLFQTVPDPRETESYSNAWKVLDVQNPGSLGPIELPEKVEFMILDKVEDVKRITGPFEINNGQEARVTQTNSEDAPKVEIVSRDSQGPVGLSEKVEIGQEAQVSQKTDAPTVEIVSGGSGPKDQIMATNMSGNAKPLEMALSKNGAKLVSFKNVKPNHSVYLSIDQVIYIKNVEGIVKGDDFKASSQATNSTKFKLFAEKPEFKIQITQRETKQLDFSEIQ